MAENGVWFRLCLAVLEGSLSIAHYLELVSTEPGSVECASATWQHGHWLLPGVCMTLGCQHLFLIRHSHRISKVCILVKFTDITSRI